MMELWKNAAVEIVKTVEVVKIGRTRKPEDGGQSPPEAGEPQRPEIGGRKSGGGGWSRLQPFPDVFGESH